MRFGRTVCRVVDLGLRPLLRRVLRLLVLNLFQLLQQLVGAGETEQLGVVVVAQIGDVERRLLYRTMGAWEVLQGFHQ